MTHATTTRHLLIDAERQLESQKVMGKGTYRDKGGNYDLLGILGATAGLGDLEGDNPDNPPPWIADPAGWQDQHPALAEAIAYVAHVCHQRLGWHDRIEVRSRLTGNVGDGYARSLIATWNDQDNTNVPAARKVLRTALEHLEHRPERRIA